LQSTKKEQNTLQQLWKWTRAFRLWLSQVRNTLFFPSFVVVEGDSQTNKITHSFSLFILLTEERVGGNDRALIDEAAALNGHVKITWNSHSYWGVFRVCSQVNWSGENSQVNSLNSTQKKVTVWIKELISSFIHPSFEF
jgi:hypothetical protein